MVKEKLIFLWYWLNYWTWYINIKDNKQLIIGSNRVDWHDLFKCYKENDRFGAHLGRFYFVCLQR